MALPCGHSQLVGEKAMSDWVAIASYLAVAVAALIAIVLVVKGYNLVYKDKD